MFFKQSISKNALTKYEEDKKEYVRLRGMLLSQLSLGVNFDTDFDKITNIVNKMGEYDKYIQNYRINNEISDSIKANCGNYIEKGNIVKVVSDMMHCNSRKAGIPVLNKIGTVIDVDTNCSCPVTIEVEGVEFSILPYDLEFVSEGK